MKLDENKKSIFNNLCEIIESFKDEEIANFEEFLKGNQKSSSSKELKRFLSLKEKIEDRLILNSDDEYELKQEIEKELESEISDVNKPYERLYKKLLEFIRKEYTKSEFKNWQLELSERLLEVEALAQRSLFSQAISQLIKLEKEYTPLESKHKSVFDDIGLFSRMANLKVELLKRDDTQMLNSNKSNEVLHNLLQVGYYFYSTHLDHSNMFLFEKHKLLGYRLLAMYFREHEEFSQARKMINNAQVTIEENRNISDQEYEILSAYLELYEHFLSLKLGEDGKEKNVIGQEKNYHPTVMTMLLEQQRHEITLVGKIQNPESFEEKELVNLCMFSEMRINSLPTRREVNTCILLFLKREYEECRRLLSELRNKKEINSSSNPIFLNILFLDMLCRFQLGNTDFENDIRNLKKAIKKTITLSSLNEENYGELEFEKEALKLFRKYMNLSEFGKKDFINQNKKEIDILNSQKDDLNPIHSLVVATLSGKY